MPLVVSDIVLLDRIDPTTSLIPSKDIDVGFLEVDSRHGAPLLVHVGNSLPSVQVDRVSLTALKNPIDRPATDGIYIVALVGQGVRVPRLVERRLLSYVLRLGVIHEHRPRNVCETRVEASSDQDVAVIQPNSYRVRLQHQFWRHFLSGPVISPKVVLQDQVLVVAVSEEVGFSDRLVLLVIKLEGVLV